MQTQRQPTLTVGVKNAAWAQQELAAAGWAVQQTAADRLQVKAFTEYESMATNRLLMQRKLVVFHLAVAQASLEDIFLSLTNSEKKEA